jgi:hypothetical protein
MNRERSAPQAEQNSGGSFPSWTWPQTVHFHFLDNSTRSSRSEWGKFIRWRPSGKAVSNRSRDISGSARQKAVETRPVFLIIDTLF